MSEHRQNDMAADPAVSDIYRELSKEERTPNLLDKRILTMAADGSPKKSVSRLLAIKPLAWAATIVLTVTLVIHFEDTDLPGTLVFEDDVPTKSDASLSKETTPSGAEPESADASTNNSRFRHSLTADTDALTEIPVEPGSEASALPYPATSRPSPASLKTQTVPVDRQDAQPAVAADMAAFDPAADARSNIEKVEEMAGEQEAISSSLRDTAEPAVSVDRRRMQTPAEPRYCGEIATADAASWYQCILALEKEGKLEQALAERTRLFSEYPDFQIR